VSRALKRLGRHLLAALVVLWLVSVVVFLATSLLPGDAAQVILGREATPASLSALRAELHLGGNPFEEYGRWLSSVVQLDFGKSLANGRPVTGYVADLIGNSLVLTSLAAVLTIPPSLALGVLLAYRRDTRFDHLTSALSLTLIAMPEFVLAMLLVIVFSTGLWHVLPAVSPAVGTEPPWSHPSEMVLPALTLALAVAPYLIQMMRALVIEILESEYVEHARLSGASERQVILNHAVPNAIGPVTQVIALQLAFLAGGVVIVEVVFAYPGLGNGLVSAVLNRDLPVIQAATLFIACFYIGINLLADAITLFVTPRARVGK
jgi:peptide/nickel transport system permease protein